MKGREGGIEIKEHYDIFIELSTVRIEAPMTTAMSKTHMVK